MRTDSAEGMPVTAAPNCVSHSTCSSSHPFTIHEIRESLPEAQRMCFDAQCVRGPPRLPHKPPAQ